MIQNEDFLKCKWIFIARTLMRNFDSCIEQLSAESIVVAKKMETAKKPKDIFNLSERKNYLEILNEKCVLSKSQSDVLVNFGKYLMVMDGEDTRIRLHVKYMYLENLWLRGEMFELHQLLLKLETLWMEAATETRHYQIVYDMRNYSKVSGKLGSVASKREIHQEEVDSEPEEVVPENLGVLFHLVTQFITENRYLVAIAWCNKNLGDFKRTYGEFSKEVAAIYTLLGRIHRSRESWKLAKDCLEQSLVIREKMYGKDSDPVAITLTLLGFTFGKLKNYKKALEMCKQALVIREKIYGRNHEISFLYGKLAYFSSELKLWKDVITYELVYLEAFEKVYDITDISLIRNYTILGQAYVQTHANEKALECLCKANLGFIKKNNPGSSRTETPMTFIEESLKRNVTDFWPELINEKFGSVEETLDYNVLEAMCLYYEKTDEPIVVDMLRGWKDLTNCNLNMADDLTKGVRAIKRRLSMSSKASKSMPERGRRESITASVRQSIMGIFKGKT